MGNFLVAMGFVYAAALLVQMVCYAQSLKKTAGSIEEETVDADMATQAG